MNQPILTGIGIESADAPKRMTVSIVSHGHGEMVMALLQDLARQSIANSLEVIVTANIAETGFADFAMPGLNVRTIANQQPQGFGANHNTALRNAETTWLLILNPDISIIDAGLIERLMDKDHAAEVALVTPGICNSAGQREDSVRLNLDPLSLFQRAVLGRRSVENPQLNVDRFHWVAGMFMVLRRSAWQAVSGFDERYFLYCEDYDLCARLVAKGFRIEIDNSLSVIHNARRSSRRSPKYFRWHLASLLKVWTSRPFWRIWLADIRRSGVFR